MIFTHPELVQKSDPVIELRWRLFAHKHPSLSDFYYLYGTDLAELEAQAFTARLSGYHTYITNYTLQEHTHE